MDIKDIKDKLDKLDEGHLSDMAVEAEKDHEVQMARSDLYKAANYAISIHKMLKSVNEMQGIEGWVAAKITKAADYLGSVKHYMEGDAMADADLAIIATKGSTPDMKKPDMMMPDFSTEDQEEDVTEAMDEKKFAYEQCVRDAKKGKEKANASDVYGPHAQEYHKGYNSVKEDVEESLEGILRLAGQSGVMGMSQPQKMVSESIDTEAENQYNNVDTSFKNWSK